MGSPQEGHTDAVDPATFLPSDSAVPELAIRTWRYLRIAMVVLVGGILIACLFEQRRAGCWQPSISAYYYTPARGLLVGSLFALGICLFCLKGVPEAEDVLLNLAGLAAPVIAIVPTPNAGTCTTVTFESDRALNIHNNVAAYLCMVGAGLVVIGFLGGRTYLAEHRGHQLDRAQFITRLVGYLLAASAFVLAWILFAFHFESFAAHAHDWAASITFGCINIVAWINCYYWAKKRKEDADREGRTPGIGRLLLKNPYTYIAAGMLLSFIIIDGVVTKIVARPWHQSTLVLEICQILLFALFWVIQTAELWRPGLRVRRISSPDVATGGTTSTPRQGGRRATTGDSAISTRSPAR